MKKKCNGEVIDEHAQVILWVLRDSDQPLAASDLIDDLKLETKQTVRYRIKKLERAELIHVVETVDNRNIADTKYYQITEEGLDWLYEHQDEVEHAVSRERYLDSVERLRERIEDSETEISRIENTLERVRRNLKSEIEEHAEELDNKESNIAFIHTRTKETKKTVGEITSSISNMKQDIKSLENDVSRIDDQIEEIKQEQDDLTKKVRVHKRHIEKNRGAIESIQEELDEMSIKTLFAGN